MIIAATSHFAGGGRKKVRILPLLQALLILVLRYNFGQFQVITDVQV